MFVSYFFFKLKCVKIFDFNKNITSILPPEHLIVLFITQLIIEMFRIVIYIYKSAPIICAYNIIY